MLLHRQVSVALEEEDVLANVVGPLEAAVDVAELERDELVDVVRSAVVLDSFVFRFRERGVDGHHRLEHLVLDGDGVAGRGCDLLVDCGDGRDGIADVPHFFMLQRALVLRDGQDAELHRQVGAGDHRLHAGDSPRRRCVDRDDASMRVRAAEDPAVQGAGEEHVVGVDRLAGDSRYRIDLRQRLPDDSELFGHCILPAASSTASRILV